MADESSPLISDEPIPDTHLSLMERFAAWIILSQILNFNNILGCVFILIGVLLSQLLPELKLSKNK